MAKAKSLPVMMYHYVSDYPNSIAVSRALFEEHCRALAEKGWRGVGLDEAEAFFVGKEDLPDKSVLFTFDDGYLDNYINAQPILYKYGHKGVMCSVSSCIEDSNEARASVDELLAGKIPGKGSIPEIPGLNKPIYENELGYDIRKDIFCNRAEIKAMDEAGIIRVISHCQKHLGVYLGPEYTAFIQPENQKRTFYHTHCPRPYGLPDFKVLGGLMHKAFIPNPDFVEDIISLVPQKEREADEFFKDKAKVERLENLVKKYEGALGRYESDRERKDRMVTEIVQGKEELEAVLGYKVKSLCWPWGMYDDLAMDIAKDAGFKVFITTQEGANPPGKADAVKRFKAKAQSGNWLLSRVNIYSRPWLGELYGRIRI